jgi:hypothetical protein
VSASLFKISRVLRKDFMAKKSNKKSSLKTGDSTLSVFQECTIDFFYYDEGADVEIEGEVKIDDSRIVVSYESEDEGYVVYQGIEKGKGHYELRASAVNGRATLHMFENSSFLEGFWYEQNDGRRGMWRIKLS